MADPRIVPYAANYRTALIALSLDAWDPVFAATRAEVPAFVYDAFYPEGWRTRQAADVAALLDGEPDGIHVALVADEPAGFVGLRLHPEDRMGEIHILAVAPRHQRQGIGGRLLAFAEDAIRRSGMTMAMVETVGDSGHAPARRAYETRDYRPWPVARYFKPL